MVLRVLVLASSEEANESDLEVQSGVSVYPCVVAVLLVVVLRVQSHLCGVAAYGFSYRGFYCLEVALVEDDRWQDVWAVV